MGLSVWGCTQYECKLYMTPEANPEEYVESNIKSLMDPETLTTKLSFEIYKCSYLKRRIKVLAITRSGNEVIAVCEYVTDSLDAKLRKVAVVDDDGLYATVRSTIHIATALRNPDPSDPLLRLVLDDLAKHGKHFTILHVVETVAYEDSGTSRRMLWIEKEYLIRSTHEHQP